MKKYILMTLTILAFIACAKKESRRDDPMQPVDVAHDSAEVQASKKAAQEADAEAKKHRTRGRKNPAKGVTTPSTTDGSATASDGSASGTDTSGTSADGAQGTGSESSGDSTTKSLGTQGSTGDDASDSKIPLVTHEELGPVKVEPLPMLTEISVAPENGNTGAQATSTAGDANAAAAGSANGATTGDANGSTQQAGAAGASGAEAAQAAAKKVEVPVKTAQTKSTATTAATGTEKQVKDLTDRIEGLAAAETYVGSMLTLSYKNEGDFGRIRLSGAEAAKLYETLRLQITTQAGNKDWEAAKVKTGANVQCFSQAPKATPKVPAYSCVVFVDYTNGSTRIIGKNPEADSRVGELAKDFTGQSLFLTVKPFSKSGELRLYNADAKALYDVLKSSAQTVSSQQANTEVLRKKGTNLYCHQGTKTKEQKTYYSCSIYFNPETGKAFAVP